jgi:hypothetical protein
LVTINRTFLAALRCTLGFVLCFSTVLVSTSGDDAVADDDPDRTAGNGMVGVGLSDGVWPGVGAGGVGGGVAVTASIVKSPADSLLALTDGVF